MSHRLLAAFLVLSALALTSCVTKRTVTKKGRVVEDGYVIKRPVKNFIENVEVE